MRQMVDIHDYNCSVLGVQQVPLADTKSYGIVDSRCVTDRLEAVQRIVEKTSP